MVNTTSKHEALLGASVGYRAFCEERLDDARYFDLGNDDELMLPGFADWLLYYPSEASDYAGWSTDDFRAKWDHWNS